MRKDKKWLRDEVKSLFDEAYESGKMEYYESEESIHRINSLVDQLDEPETLSQEWIDENKVARIDNLRKMTTSDVVPVEKLKNLLVPKQEITFEQAHDKLREESILSEKSFDYYWNCINDNVEIDEPGNILVTKQEKPVIPHFVADYIEQSKKDNDSINQVFAFMDDKEDKDLWHWLFPSVYEEKRANQEVFMRAWLDGYEVEKEKKYYIYDKSTKGYLGYNADKTRLSWYTSSFPNDVFTEQEIKAIDKRYWAFAEEVKPCN